MKKNNISSKVWHPIYLIVIFFISFLFGASFNTFTPHYFFKTPKQYVGNSLHITDFNLSQGGFVVVKIASKDDKNGERFIGFSDFFPAGQYKEVHFELFDLKSRGPVTSGDQFVAVIYLDNGDKIFDRDLDRPAKNIFGKVVENHGYFQ